MCVCVCMLFWMTKLHTMCMRNVINIRPVQHALTIVFLQPSTPCYLRRLVSEKIPTDRIGFVLKSFFFFFCFQKTHQFLLQKIGFSTVHPAASISCTRDELYYCAVDIFAEIDRTKKNIFILDSSDKRP